jgi:pimeloyl-ACP methyl ester carboxylesterase
MLQQFKANGDRAMVRKLEAAPVTRTGGTPDTYRALRDPAMHSLGIGTTHDMKSILSGLFFPSWLSREYTFSEKVKLWRGKASSGISSLWDEMITTDLSEQVPKLDLPVYFLSGIYDYTVNYTLARAYFEKLQAPAKGFYTFEQSAHSPIFEEPEKSRQILREDVLAGVNHLADTK